MYCNILLCCCECEPNSRDSHQHGRRVAGALLLALFLRHPANVFLRVAEEKHFFESKQHLHLYDRSEHSDANGPKIREILKLKSA